METMNKRLIKNYVLKMLDIKQPMNVHYEERKMFLNHYHDEDQKYVNEICERTKKTKEELYKDCREFFLKLPDISMEAYNNNLDYQELLSKNEKIMSILTKEELDSCFTLDYYQKNVEAIYKRVNIL